MSLIVEGRNFQFLFLIITLIVGAYITYLLEKKKIKVGEMRKIAGFEAINEGIGRAVEQNRPMYFDPGTGGFSRIPAGIQNVASLNILSYVAAQSVKAGAELITISYYAEAYPIIVDTIKNAYIASGFSDHSPDVRFVASVGWAPPMFSVGTMSRERVTFAIQAGGLGTGYSLMFAEGAIAAGAIVISATAQTGALPLVVAASDYTLIGDELYSAGAYISKAPEQEGSIYMSDLLKIFILALIILASILKSVGSDIIIRLLQW